MDAPNEPRFVRSVNRAIDVLDHLARNGKPMTLSEIFRAVKAPKSTTLNIVRTLVHRRVLDFDVIGKRYHAGPMLVALARDAGRSIDVAKMARPYLEGLAASTGETALLGVLDKDELVYIEGVDSAHPVRFVANIGLRRPLHSTSGGKLALALRDEAAWEDYIQRAGLTRLTDKTITDAEKFRAELRRTRERGYGLNQSETVPDVIGVAVPVLAGSGGPFLASLVVPGPAYRVRPNLKAILKHLQKAAVALSDELAGA